jgi:hypothetical protein
MHVKKQHSHLTQHTKHKQIVMGDDSTDTHELCKATICMKDQEIFILRSELDNQYRSMQSLGVAIERMERSITTSIERFMRKLERNHHNRRR